METNPPFHPWTHRFAWLLAVVVFALISMGGTVTTYEAGMAVRDWPTTFDYWFYPIRAWLAVWDVFLEHGHRLLGQLAGVIAIVLAILLWRDPRRSMRWVAAALLVGVAVQGTLGGLRVLADDRLLARLHGCIAPLYFTLCAAVVTWTSRRWRAATHDENPSLARRVSETLPASEAKLPGVGWLMLTAIYLEIVLGALLRRPSANTTPGDIGLLVWLKVINAGVVMALAGGLLFALRQRLGRCRQLDDLHHILRRRGFWLATALILQLALAAATWVTNYGWPEWFTRWILPLGYTVVAQGRLQVLATTSHAAVGSLLLAISLTLTLWVRKCSLRSA